MNQPTPEGVRGKTIKKDGQEYFILNNIRIKISEHFPAAGKEMDELIAELVTNKIKEKVR